MKKLIILTATVITLMLGACNNNKSGPADKNAPQTYSLDTMKLKHGETFYECSMNPEVISNKPGQCPKCGMDLSEMKKH